MNVTAQAFTAAEMESGISGAPVMTTIAQQGYPVVNERPNPRTSRAFGGFADESG